MSAEDVVSQLANFDGGSSVLTKEEKPKAMGARTIEEEPKTLRLERKIEPLVEPTLQTILFDKSESTFPTENDHVANRLSDDVATLILSHLSLTEIAAVSETCRGFHQVCRSNQLWKTLFDYRWNAPSLSEDSNYFQAYQQAHWHPHDLWVTHWNCLYPAEGLSPGRCCIRSMQRSPRKAFRGGQTQCPTCRSYNDDDDDNDDAETSRLRKTPLSAAQKEAQRTRRLRQKLVSQGVKLPDLCAHNTEETQRNAFAAAATFHRKLDLEQYRPGMTHFLTDLLFFNLTDPFTDQGDWELEQLLSMSQEPTALLPAGGSHTPSHHSWHTIELRNPDRFRPILYQFGVQRPECFTVYPSEGLIEAGGSVHVTIGVTPFGSALAYAMEGLDIHRDGLAGEWASLYTAEAHLPLAPFLIRYRFANASPHSDMRRRYVVSNNSTIDSSKQAVLEYHFQQDFPPHHFRSIYLSAHVNAHYNYWKFFQRTCQPWIVERRQWQGPLWVAPLVAEKYPAKWRLLDEVLDRKEVYCRNPKFTEGPCEGCGLLWGARDEELVFEYLTAFAMAWWYERQRHVMLKNIALCIDVIPTIAERSEEAVAVLLYNIFSVIQTFKISKLIEECDKQALVKQEIAVDELCRGIRVGGETWIPWRLSGVYKYSRCTDSVLGETAAHPGGMEEPTYLDAFRHLTHCPGSFCLGRQVDPNHVASSIQPSSSRFVQKQGNPVSDIFMDDPISALQAGICMLHDPRSLLLHGVYDRVRYPGSLIRRPRMYPLMPLPADTADSTATLTATYGLIHYLHDVPPPGIGRFALSTFQFREGGPEPEIIEIEIEDDMQEEVEGDFQQEQTVLPSLPRIEAQPPRNRRGPRFVQMLWTLGASLGLVVIDSSAVSSVFVDRTILIATHWISISLMIAPLLITLIARCFNWIPTQPVDYNLEGLPFTIHNEMRFLTQTECGMSAIILAGAWMVMGRWSERHTYRDLFRAMLEHLTPDEHDKSFFRRQLLATKLWLLRRWDAFCPLFLQRRTFSPQWNIRTRADLIKHFASWRSRNLLTLHKFEIAATGINGIFFGDSRDHGIDFGRDSSTRKITVGIFVVLASFCASSPHFWLNLTTVFSSSVSLGISISVQSLEKGRPEISVTNTGSFLRELNLLTVFIFAFLVGQLVGSSGGTMFLAEFIVTSISLVLGGAGTVSASAMESWITFFILALTSFWGYLFGRVGLIDGILLKRRGYSNALLSTSVGLLAVFWTTVFLVGRFDSPVSLVILRHTDRETRTWSRDHAAKMLQ